MNSSTPAHQDVLTLISSKYQFSPESMQPGDFNRLWGSVQQAATSINAELSRNNADMDKVYESAQALVTLAPRLRLADKHLRSQTDNGKRPHSHRGQRIDHAGAIENLLVLALTNLRNGESRNELGGLLQRIGDAHTLARDAFDEFIKTNPQD
jgi:hypothetical protein